MRFPTSTLLIVAVSLVAFQDPAPGFSDTFQPGQDHRAIQYTARAAMDPIARLNQRISNRQIRLGFEPDSGYLRSVLAALMWIDFPNLGRTFA